MVDYNMNTKNTIFSNNAFNRHISNYKFIFKQCEAINRQLLFV